MKFQTFVVMLLGGVVTFLSGCSDRPDSTELNQEQLNSYIEESSKNSYHVWFLEKQDRDYYYIRREAGSLSFDNFRLSKRIVKIDTGNEQFPKVLKFIDIQQVQE